MFERLSRKEILIKEDEAIRFGVDKKTIQRDIAELRAYLADFANGQGASEINYCNKSKGYILVGQSDTWLTNEHILALTRVLLESRAFCRDEMEELLRKLVMQCNHKEAKRIEEIIRNELHHYVAVKHNMPLLHAIWELSEAVRAQKLVKISYRRVNQEIVERLVKPQAVIFAEYYFYLIGHLKEQNDDFSIPYRLDRLLNYQVTPEHFSYSYSRRFEEGEFRKRIQFMYPGDLMRIQIRYWGESEEAILDRLPTARVIKREGRSTYIEAEVFGTGIKMWLLSQAQHLEVLGPPAFRAEIEDTINNMLKIYRNTEKTDKQ